MHWSCFGISNKLIGLKMSGNGIRIACGLCYAKRAVEGGLIPHRKHR